IEEKKSRGTPEQNGESKTALFASRKHADGLEDVVAAKQEAAEETPSVALAKVRALEQVTEHRIVAVERVSLVLREVAGIDAGCRRKTAGDGWHAASNRLEKRRLADAV